MNSYPESFERLTEKFAGLPGVGRKSAQRMAFYILSLSDAEAGAFADAITDAKRRVKRCRICQNLTDSEICPICGSDKRDKSVICVVSQPRDVTAFERTREYKGLYHVLHGVISPLKHIGPDDIAVKELLARLDPSVEEIILATDPDAEGEATAMYISRLVKQLGVKTTRIAYGIPVGSNLEVADDATLYRALEGRREI
ncbi:MAG: recombination mediator RecR [Oscillospiraceae bacterium]|nr:recombination mediator RecR [Oscillospiraceae bacterium]